MFLLYHLDYLCNIFEAVEVSPNNDLQAIKELLVVDKEKYVFPYLFLYFEYSILFNLAF